MKTTLSTQQIADALRSDEKANWSTHGSLALAKYMEYYEDSVCATGEELELDVEGMNEDFSEYKSLQAWIKWQYGSPLAVGLKSAGIDMDGDESEEETDDLIRDHINDEDQLIEFSGGIIVSSF